jgi:hypothetical protein
MSKFAFLYNRMGKFFPYDSPYIERRERNGMDALSNYAITIGVFIAFGVLLFSMRAKRPHGSSIESPTT